MYENTKQSVLPRSVLSQLKLRILFGVIYRFAANALNEKKKVEIPFLDVDSSLELLSQCLHFTNLLPYHVRFYRTYMY